MNQVPMHAHSLRASAARPTSIAALRPKARDVQRRSYGAAADETARVVQEAVEYARRSGQVNEALQAALQQNEMLKQQVLSEGQRASAASRELSTIMTRVKDQDKRQAEMMKEAAERDAAMSKFQNTFSALEDAKREKERIMQQGAPQGRQQSSDAERAARQAAEQKVRELEAKLSEAEAFLESAPQAGHHPTPTGSNQDALQAVLRENELLKQQLSAETARASAAKELANTRYKELEAVSEKVRSDESLVKKMKADVAKAMKAAADAQAELQQAHSSNAQLAAQVQVEEERAARATQDANELMSELERAQAMLMDEDRRLQAAAASNPDVAAALALRGALTKAERTNEVMREQMRYEASRAASAEAELAKVAAVGRQLEQLREAAQRERHLREEAQQASMEAATLLDVERRKAQSLLSDASSSSRLVEEELRAKAAADARIQELEAKLVQAKSQLDSVRAVQGAGPASGDRADAVAKACSMIALLKEQLQGETARAEEAKAVAARRQRELQETRERLSVNQKKIDMVAQETARAMADARAAEERLSRMELSNEELMQQLRAETNRAQRAESQVVELSQSLRAAKAEIANQTRQFQDVIVSAKELQGAQNALADALAMNEILKRQLQAENSRASRSAKELTVVQEKVKMVEGTLGKLRTESDKMKDTFIGLRQAISNAIVYDDQDPKLREVQDELKKAKREEAKGQKESAQLKDSLAAARSRVQLLEMEIADIKQPTN